MIIFSHSLQTAQVSIVPVISFINVIYLHLYKVPSILMFSVFVVNLLFLIIIELEYVDFYSPPVLPLSQWSWSVVFHLLETVKTTEQFSHDLLKWHLFIRQVDKDLLCHLSLLTSPDKSCFLLNKDIANQS